MPEKLIPLCADLYRGTPPFLGKLQEDLWEHTQKPYVDNRKIRVKKRCRKKNFFDRSFAAYFAILTDGNIRLTKKY